MFPFVPKWSNNFFKTLFGYEWELTKSPAGAHQWTAKGGAGAGTVPDAHDPSKRHAPTMLTTDLSLVISCSNDFICPEGSMAVCHCLRLCGW